jgi:hypothetical protein
MSDNVVKLQFDLAQTEAALKKSQELVAKLREEVKKCKDESKNANETAAKGYNKSATEVRTLTKEVESGSGALRRMGGALNQIGGAGTGQIAQVAGAIGMLATGPIGLVTVALSGVGIAWAAISSKIEEAKKRAEEFGKSIQKVNTEAVKQSADLGKSATSRDTIEAKARLGVTYAKPDETLRKMQEDFGYTEKENIGILTALQPRMRKIPKDQQQKTLTLVMNAIQAANIGAGVDPVDAAKGMIESPMAFSTAAAGQRYSSAAKVSSNLLGFRVPWEQIQARTEENVKSPALIESFREQRLAAKMLARPETVDIQRREIQTNREILEGSLRGGKPAGEIIEKQVEEQRKRGAPLGEGRSTREYSEILKLKETLQAQNPEAQWYQVQLFIDRLTTAIETNTLSNQELKKSLDENNAKTEENTEATATGMGK